MSYEIAIGQAFSVEGREAVGKAVYDARVQLGNQHIVFAIVIASFEYDFEAIYSAAQTQIGDVPMIGFSTSGQITAEGVNRRSVVIALFTSEALNARSEWLPGFASASEQITREALNKLALTSDQKGLLLLVADGFSGDYEALINALPPGRYQFAGCLAGGDLRLGKTHQLGGSHAGHGGLAAAFLSGGGLKVGIGTGHGWQQVGATFKVTETLGPWVRSLDNKPASEQYASLFGRQAKEWAYPPLSSLVRLYPLGIERENQPMIIRTPLHVEADGSLRMSTEIPVGAVGHLLVGSRDKCIEAAGKATDEALEALNGAAPKLALVLTDVSWQLLFQGYEGEEFTTVREKLGKDVLIVGGYTFGQFTHMRSTQRPEFLNQHVEVVLFGFES